VDETGWLFNAPTGTTWAPIGKTPVLRRISKRRELSTLIGLTITGRIYKRHFTKSVSGMEVVETLHHFGRHIHGPLLIIWDRSRPHRSKVVQNYLTTHPEIYIEWLPPYAPELNPEEYCHGNVKQHLRNATPNSVAEMRQQVDCGFARIRKSPDLLLGFFHQAGLKLKQLWK
jgi:transposase